MILFNIIFLILYTISKFSSHSISANCKDKSCDNCAEPCKVAFFKKYPYVAWFNLLCLLFIIADLVYMGSYLKIL